MILLACVNLKGNFDSLIWPNLQKVLLYSSNGCTVRTSVEPSIKHPNNLSTRMSRSVVGCIVWRNARIFRKHYAALNRSNHVPHLPSEYEDSNKDYIGEREYVTDEKLKEDSANIEDKFISQVSTRVEVNIIKAYSLKKSNSLSSFSQI